MKILETVNLSKTYGKKDIAVHTLRGANLSVNKGEFVAIVGPSGSGKSTFLHLIGGLERANTGTIKINGKDICCMSDKDLAKYRRQEVGFIFQQYNLIPVLNVRENIELPVKLDKHEVDKEYIDGIIRTIGLEDREKHLPNQLSGGQQQRVAIARSLSSKPSIILADEPTGKLDSKTTGEVIDLLKESIRKYNQTLIMITHNEAISEKADGVINIIDGKLSEAVSQ
ncbi:MAG: ABC transporter ATP-binding protein [Clostridioides sp.]|nr:ABC transporter ATP-binding protein [Clostridioides sp.]